MKELLDKHIAIMDRYDPEGRIGLIIDEWGAWYNVEPNTKPGFLYQQNTMRDALIAGINLNLFNQYSHRITMANIAQMVNVLQSMILTSDDQMVRTPTYYVFELYKEHQDSTLLESSIDVPMIGSKDHQVPAIIESASRTKKGDIIITLCHLDNTKSRTIDMSIEGINIRSVSGEYISGHINDYNDFTSPDVITKKAYTNYVQEHGTIKLILDPCSITKLIVQTNNQSSDK
jgi:alpha-N-arabinofuranosidase